MLTIWYRKFNFWPCLLLILGGAFLFSCQPDRQEEELETQRLFSRVLSEHSGLDFINGLEETVQSNYYQYMYTYIGGGVAAGDINNDGLEDLFFISNSSQNRLYLNLGNLQFEEITAIAGIENRPGFDTGVTMVDINGDGFLDIYICRGGANQEGNRFANMVYINNGDLSFSERGEELGLADKNRAIQASFFDYDNDEDLDVYISNTPDIEGRAEVVNLKERHDDPETQSLLGSDRLYENDGSGNFIDVSEKAGLEYDMGFGLNPQVGDLNQDGWLDIYVCNDFNGPDLVYLNNGDGTFSESRDKVLKHMSFNSMGSDLADINNDGLMDLMTLDMNPEDYIRSKTTMAMTSIDQFELMVANGYHHQYMHNMLQLNNGSGTFSEIGNMSGIANTDWSWSVLSADFDLDGLNDLFVTNGVFRDVIDRDKNKEILALIKSNDRQPTPADFLAFAQMLPQQKLNNYLFKNNGDLTFSDKSETWVEPSLTFSNGATYADLDNDGDLDLVVSNLNEEVHLLENNSNDQGEKNYLAIKLNGPPQNRFGIGATVTLELSDGSKLIRQQIPTRGFLSSVSHKLHYGIPKNETINNILVVWPGGNRQSMDQVNSNQTITLDYGSAIIKERSSDMSSEGPIFNKRVSKYSHIDPYFNDYQLQVLLPYKLSHIGPAAATKDINADGHADIYLGGGKDQPGQILLGKADGSFLLFQNEAFADDKFYEDQAACFFDLNNDGFQDLYVGSGSYEFYSNPRLLKDRLYLGDGTGRFVKTEESVPPMLTSTSVVVPSDIDQDGDMDLFVGGRVVPGAYPYPPDSYLLLNEDGVLLDGTDIAGPELATIGMVTDATWADMNADGVEDLVVVGEWMGVEIFLNERGLHRTDFGEICRSTTGWWNAVLVSDVDQDGDQDIVAGNLGLNSKFQASPTEPFHIYTSDFDMNGVEDIVLAKRYQGREVPIRGKTCMTQQIPRLAQTIPSYEAFAKSDVADLVGNLDGALHYQATEFRTGIFMQMEAGEFEFKAFDNLAQRSPCNAIVEDDFDGDGAMDLLLAGNNYHFEVETTRADAGVGSFAKGDGKGGYKCLDSGRTGLVIDRDIRHILQVGSARETQLLVVNNNGPHEFLRTR